MTRRRSAGPSAQLLSSRRARGPLALLAAALLALGAWLAPGLVPGTGNVPTAPVTLTDRQASYSAWDPVTSPDYYRIVGTAVADVDLAPGEVRYAGLDALGRTGQVAANVTYDMMKRGSERSREDISRIHPAGWGHNEEVDIVNPDGSTYHGTLYNRSHLLAKSLGGDDAEYNLVTGTRTQNVGDNHGQDGGMAFTEGLARDWLRENPDGTVLYLATPVYEGAELLPRSVLVDVLSSDGAIDLEVEVYNDAAGYDIDYATGAFSVAGE